MMMGKTLVGLALLAGLAPEGGDSASGIPPIRSEVVAAVADQPEGGDPGLGIPPGTVEGPPGFAVPSSTCSLPIQPGANTLRAMPFPVSSAPVEAPAYYAFPVVSTRRLPGTGLAVGLGEVTFPDSPYGVTLAADGSYLLDVWLSVERLMPPREGVYVGWLTTPNLDEVERVGPLAEGGQLQGRARWNKFLLVVTLEPEDDPGATMWTGPVVMRGMSRSGQMHTMAGHGAFEEENCAAYGYD